MSNSDNTSRRNFLKKATAATSAAIITSKTRTEAKPIDITPEPEPLPQVSPNDRIRLGLIGAGGQGTGDTAAALRVPGVELVAVADIYDGRHTAAKERFGNHLVTTRDHREILARNDIDAVIIGTPDHWHARSLARADCERSDEGGQRCLLRKTYGATIVGRCGCRENLERNRAHYADWQPVHDGHHLPQGQRTH